MYLALYDMASKVVTNIDDYLSTRNPESYAWFAAASYLSRHGEGKMDWSTGAARPDGSDQESVTVPIPPRHLTGSPETFASAPTTFATVGINSRT